MKIGVKFAGDASYRHLMFSFVFSSKNVTPKCQLQLYMGNLRLSQDYFYSDSSLPKLPPIVFPLLSSTSLVFPNLGPLLSYIQPLFSMTALLFYPEA
jgi:hypothetical protein